MHASGEEMAEQQRLCNSSVFLLFSLQLLSLQNSKKNLITKLFIFNGHKQKYIFS